MSSRDTHEVQDAFPCLAASARRCHRRPGTVLGASQFPGVGDGPCLAARCICVAWGAVPAPQSPGPNSCSAAAIESTIGRYGREPGDRHEETIPPPVQSHGQRLAHGTGRAAWLRFQPWASQSRRRADSRSRYTTRSLWRRRPVVGRGSRPLGTGGPFGNPRRDSPFPSQVPGALSVPQRIGRTEPPRHAHPMARRDSDAWFRVHGKALRAGQRATPLSRRRPCPAFAATAPRHEARCLPLPLVTWIGKRSREKMCRQSWPRNLSAHRAGPTGRRPEGFPTRYCVPSASSRSSTASPPRRCSLPWPHTLLSPWPRPSSSSPSMPCSTPSGNRCGGCSATG